MCVVLTSFINPSFLNAMKTTLLPLLACITLGMAKLFGQTANLTLVTNPCNNNGQVSVTTTGLTLPISYDLLINGYPYSTHANVNSTSDVFSGFPAIVTSGVSNVRVVARSGSTTVNSNVVNFTPAFTYSVSTVSPLCPAQASITVNSIVGGTAPFSYQFINTITSQSFATNPAVVPPGNYSVTVSDAAGCRVVCSFSGSIGAAIPNNSPVSLSMTGTAANCTNGTAWVTASGGVGPYTYLWSNGATSQNINSLMSGLYTCTVTDTQGCYKMGAYSVSQAVNLTFNSSVTNATCIQTNGSVLGFVSGGTAPYTFLWSNGATTQNVSGLAGNTTYHVLITDANNCKGTGVVNVSSTTPITTTYVTSASSCTVATGGATLSPSGGTGPYTTLWYTYPTSSTGNGISNKSAGNYGFLITDAVGCIRTGSVVIPTASTLNASINVSSFACPATTGSLTANVSGSNGPFTYTWSNGSSAAALNGVPAGNYGCLIKDAVGCTLSKFASLSPSNPITVGFSSTPASCVYAADGSLLANAMGGTAPYTYTWSNAQTGATATGLRAGNYYVSVSDANGCRNNYYSSMASVGYNASANSCYCTITGTVYADANNNCVRDAGENGINNIQIHCSGIGYTYTNANGVYSFLVPTGTYTISESVQQVYPLAPCQANHTAVSVTAASGCVSTVDFANNVVPIHDLHILTGNYNQPVPGNPYTQMIIVQNEGTITESNIKLGYKTDGQLFYGTSSPWTLTQQNASSYPNWYSIQSGFPTLNAGTSSYSFVNYMVPANIPINTTVNFLDTVAHAAPLATTWFADNTPWTNVNNHDAIVVSSFDPNFKEVSPKGTGAPGYITIEDSILTYVVHFQNEGTYYAQNIVVVDSLSPYLDITTLRPGFSNKNYTTKADENGVIRFKFDNVNLPWKSMYGDMMSSGMFTYSVKLKHALPAGTKIKNTAAIYFDYNAPVITNTTLNTIADPGPVSVKEHKAISDDDVVLFPNPANNGFSLLISSAVKTESELSITDISGRVLSQRSVSLQAGQNTLRESTDQLQSGIYFVQLKNTNALITKKLVIAR